LKILVVEGGRRDSVVEGLQRSTDMVNILKDVGFEAVFARDETDRELVKSLLDNSPDIVFCAASHLPDAAGNPLNAHTTLEAIGYPFVGSSSSVIDLALSKDALKKRWIEVGVRTPGYFVASARASESDAARAERPASAHDFPYIVKPCREGDSRGISAASVVMNPAALGERIAFVNSNYGDALVERFLGFEPDCREYSVALIGTPRHGLVLPIAITFREDRSIKVVTHEDKMSQATVVKPVEDVERRLRLESFARAAFAAAGARDYARCDIIEAGGELFAIEINAQPMVPDRWFEACASGVGLGPKEYPVAIVLAAIWRLRGEGRLLPPLGDALRVSFPEAVEKALHLENG